jgi:hypothetical protein
VFSNFNVGANHYVQDVIAFVLDAKPNHVAIRIYGDLPFERD